MPKGNIIDLEKSEKDLLDIKLYGNTVEGKKLKKNQDIVDFAIELATRYIEHETKLE